MGGTYYEGTYYGDTSYEVASTTQTAGAALGILSVFMIIISIILIAQLVAMWKVFTKAGKPGWAAIIPIYNMYILCKIAEKQWWYILLMGIPVVSFWAMYVVYDGVAKKFGKGTGFTLGMLFLTPIFFIILGFGKSNVYASDASISTVDNTNSVNAYNTISNEGAIGDNQSVVENVNTTTMETTNTQSVDAYTAPSFDTPAVNQSVVQPVNDFNTQVSQPVEQAPVANDFIAQPAEQSPVAPIVNEPATQTVEQAPVVNNFAAQPVEQAPVAPVANEAATQTIEQVPVVNDFNVQASQPVEQAPINNNVSVPSNSQETEILDESSNGSL